MITSELMSVLMARQMVKNQFEYSEEPEPEPGSVAEKTPAKLASGSFLIRFFKRLNFGIGRLSQVFYPADYKTSRKKFDDC